MEPWMWLSFRIGTFGFLKEFRPEDPYITQYLVGPVMNLTEEQVNQEVYPVATYVGLVQAAIMFLLTDLLRYKPIIILLAASGVISQGILMWARGLRAMQVMEVFYATMTACEVAYSTYIYAKVDKVYYQKVTSHMRAAALTGRFISAVLGQVLLSFSVLDVASLNHLTFAGMCCALVCALFLPSMSHSIYFHRKSDEPQSPSEEKSEEQSEGRINTSQPGTSSDIRSPVPDSSPEGKWKGAAKLLWNDFKDAYSKPYVLKMCIWVTIATCGYNQMMTYTQILWVNIGGKQQVAYNGAVEAVYTIMSALSALAVGPLSVDWHRYGELVVGLLTTLLGGFILSSALTDSMVVAYSAYILFGVLYTTVLIVANSEVARNLTRESYALVFGVNTFVALILQSMLTFVVAGSSILALNITQQFLIYGGYFIILGSAFIVKYIITLFF